jgi:hypothetical protein
MFVLKIGFIKCHNGKVNERGHDKENKTADFLFRLSSSFKAGNNFLVMSFITLANGTVG